MDQKVMKIEDLNPDGIRVIVNWDKLTVSGSVFIPCVDTEKTKIRCPPLHRCDNGRLNTKFV